MQYLRNHITITDPKISPTSPLIFTGGQKVRFLALSLNNARLWASIVWKLSKISSPFLNSVGSDDLTVFSPSLVQISPRIFTALQYAGWSFQSRRCPSVCPSVRPSVCHSVNSDKTKAPSEKSSIMTNRKSPTTLPMSLRWTSYVAPNPPKGASKTTIF